MTDRKKRIDALVEKTYQHYSTVKDQALRAKRAALRREIGVIERVLFERQFDNWQLKESETFHRVCDLLVNKGDKMQ